MSPLGERYPLTFPAQLGLRLLLCVIVRYIREDFSVLGTKILANQAVCTPMERPAGFRANLVDESGCQVLPGYIERE